MSDVVLGKEKPVEESNPEYEKLKHYIFELEDHLAEAQKQAFRLVKRHRGNKEFKNGSLGRLASYPLIFFHVMCFNVYITLQLTCTFWLNNYGIWK